MNRLSELVESRELVVNLTLRELRGKYKRSVLGWAWSLLNPLASMAIFTMVFSYFLKIDAPKGVPSGLQSFPFYLIIGLLPWNYLSNGMNGSMGALIANSNLVKKVYFPREVLIFANVSSNIVTLLIEMGVLVVALLVVGNFVLPWLVPVVLLIVIQTVFVLGIGLILSVLNVYFRDVQHLIGIVLQLWFYATPIVYPITVVPARVRTFYDLNPMVRFVEAYRDCLYDLHWPPLGDWAYLAGVAVLTLVVGAMVFAHFEPKLAEEL